MNDAIERIYKLTVQADQAVTQLKKIGGAADEMQKQFAAIKTGLAGLFAGVSVGAAIEAFRSITEEADKIGKASEKFGISAESLQTLGYAAKQSGVDFDAMAKGLQNLNKQLVDVDKGTDAASKALRALGVKGTDSPEEAFRKIADGLSKIPDGATKTAAALAVFGKAGADLIPLLNEGAGGIEKLEQRARELGVVMDDEAIDQATKFNDALDDMGVAVRGVARQIVTGMLPFVSQLADEMAGAAKASSDWQDFGRGLAEVLKVVAIVAVNVARVFKAVGDGIGGFAAQVVALVHGDFAGVAAISQDMTVRAEETKKSFNDLTAKIWNLDTSAKALADTTTKKTNPAIEELQKRLKAALETQKNAEKTKTEKTAMERFVESAIKAQEEADLLLPKLDALQALFFQGKIDSDTFEKLKTGLIGTGEAATEALPPIEQYAKGLTDAQAEFDLIPEKLAKVNELYAIGAIDAKKYAEETKSLNDALRGGVDPLETYKQSLTDQQAALDRIPAQMEILNKMYADGTISLKVYNDALDQLKKTQENVTDFQKDMNQAMANGIQQGVSGFVDQVFEANQTWEEFAANFLKSIAKMIAQLLIMRAIKSSSTFGSFFGSAHGNAFAGATGLPHGVYPAGHPVYFPINNGNAPLTRFAHGGTIGVLAEGSNAEAIVPLMNHNGDLGVKASPVNITVNNTISDVAKVDVAESNSQDGSRTISMTIRREVRAAMSDGSMDTTMRANFGLNRRAVR